MNFFSKTGVPVQTNKLIKNNCEIEDKIYQNRSKMLQKYQNNEQLRDKA